jgi:hypothetical protein
MRSFILLALVFAPSILFADDWGPVQFLIGSWTGEGNGGPGRGAGSFSFTPDLQGKVLVRKSFAEYPAANGKPAARHDDLMIVYRDAASQQLRAIYFDSEEHVIQYSVKSLDGAAVFATETPPSAPRYRLTYTATSKDELKLKFEIAPPGKEFATYIEAAASRKR